MKETIVSALVGAACIIGIVAGAIYIQKHVSCWNFFGLHKGCAISTAG